MPARHTFALPRGSEIVELPGHVPWRVKTPCALVCPAVRRRVRFRDRCVRGFRRPEFLRALLERFDRSLAGAALVRRFAALGLLRLACFGMAGSVRPLGPRLLSESDYCYVYADSRFEDR